MKRILTAIGKEELNNILKKNKEVIIENTDIQYKEGIIEALDKYPLTNLIILKDDIIGEMNLEELIFKIVMIKKDIKIILITQENEKYKNDKNIIKVVSENKDYVNTIIQYLFKDININKENETKKQKHTEKIKQVITFIGASGSRKNNSYCNII